MILSFEGVSYRYPGADATKTAVARALNDNMAKLMEVGKGKLLVIGTISLLGFEKGGRQEMERAMNLLLTDMRI